MIKTATLLGAIMALTLAGCGGGGGRGSDAGITLMDSGSTATDSGSTATDSGSTATDSGSTATDSGTTTVDSGVPTGACANPIPALPASVLPRCAAATATCIQACTDGTCIQNCTAADTTASFDDGMGNTLNCGQCFNSALTQCIDTTGCHDQLARLICCGEAAGCDVNTSTCCAPEQSAVQACANPIVVGCIGTVTGAGGCFAAM